MKRSILGSCLSSRISLEETSSGETEKEVEKVIYGRVSDLSFLSNAISKEHHEQWEVKIPKMEGNLSKGRIRIRKTIPNITEVDKTEYILTTKIDYNHSSTAISATYDMFIHFKELANAGMRKDRYIFPISPENTPEGESNLKWEVDLYYIPGTALGSNQYSPWVKIDLELKNINSKIPSLPFQITDQMIVGDNDHDNTIITDLYSKVFLASAQ